jgi:hypothetical protein
MVLTLQIGHRQTSIRASQVGDHAFRSEIGVWPSILRFFPTIKWRAIENRRIEGRTRSYRLRVVVASAAFPKYDRNLNTGGDNERDTRYIVVRQRILHDRAHPSFVRLPIIPR